MTTKTTMVIRPTGNWHLDAWSLDFDVAINGDGAAHTVQLDFDIHDGYTVTVVKRLTGEEVSLDWFLEQTCFSSELEFAEALAENAIIINMDPYHIHKEVK